MRYLAIPLLAAATGCSSIGAGYVGGDHDLKAIEISAMGRGDSLNGGARVSAGQMSLPPEWAKLYGRTTERYSAGVFVRSSGKFYVEGLAEVGMYPDLGTPIELELGARLGYTGNITDKLALDVFLGFQRAMGNGDNHVEQGEYEHVPDGSLFERVAARFGFKLTWDF